MSTLPEVGDLVWVNFHPQAGHEQAGHRPALVLTPRIYHERTALAIVCPITSNTDPYPFKVTLPEGLPIAGAVLADQAKSIDRAARQLKFAGRAPRAVLLEVQGRLAALLGMDPDRRSRFHVRARCRQAAPVASWWSAGPAGKAGPGSPLRAG